jgi:flagellar hook protein FlgE
MGVGPVSSFANYTQGTIETTGGATDAAIQGNGFFIVKDPNNDTLYTRDGSFQVNSAGQLVTASGDLVQGYSAVDGVVNTSGTIGNLSVPVGATVPASATTAMTLGLNLDASAPTTGAASTFSAPVQVVDSLGNTHTLTATFTNEGNGTWNYAMTVPATDLTNGTSPTVATGTLTFGPDGTLTSPLQSTDPQTIAIGNLADGASDMSIAWSLYGANGSSNITQYAEASAVGTNSQNGFTAGQISNVSLQNGGLLTAQYSNGQQVEVGQLAMATVANPDSLSSVGDNNLAATATTGTPAIGTANTGSRGQIVAGALESSTVDIATEFTNLLTFERGYQANSRVITTTDQLLQETINLVHG